MDTGKRIGVIGSRDFDNYAQLERIVLAEYREGDTLVSGGAAGADSMAQRFAKDNGARILIIYPNWKRYGRGAGFARNRDIAAQSDFVLAFYAKGRFQQGGTRHTIECCETLEIPYYEYEDDGRSDIGASSDLENRGG